MMNDDGALPEGAVTSPDGNDVLLEASLLRSSHMGNLKWLLFVAANRGAYLSVQGQQVHKQQLIVKSIVHAVHTLPGCFLQRHENVWRRVEDDKALEATQQALNEESSLVTTIISRQPHVMSRLDMESLSNGQAIFFAHSCFINEDVEFGKTVCSSVSSELKSLANNSVTAAMVNTNGAHPHDVLWGHAQRTDAYHQGSKEWNLLVEANKPLYQHSMTTNSQKKLISKSIVFAVISQGGRFLKESNGHWNVVGDSEAQKRTTWALKRPVLKIPAEIQSELNSDLRRAQVNWIMNYFSSRSQDLSGHFLRQIDAFDIGDSQERTKTTSALKDSILESPSEIPLEPHSDLLRRAQMNYFSSHSAYFGNLMRDILQSPVPQLMVPIQESVCIYVPTVQQTTLVVPVQQTTIQERVPVQQTTIQESSVCIYVPPPLLPHEGRRTDAFPGSSKNGAPLSHHRNDSTSHQSCSTTMRLDDGDAAAPLPPNILEVPDPENQQNSRPKVLQPRAAVVFADGASQCCDNDDILANAAQDENMVGVTLDGMPLNKNGFRTVAEPTAMNVDDDALQGGLQYLQSSNGTNAAADITTQGGLDFLADVADRAQKSFPSSPRRVSTGHRHGHDNSVGGKRQSGHVGYTEHSAHTKHDGIVVAETSFRSSARRVSSGNGNHASLVDKSNVTTEHASSSMLYFDDQGTLSRNNARRVSNEDDGHYQVKNQTHKKEQQGSGKAANHGDTVGSIRKDKFDFSHDSDDDEKEVVSTKSGKNADDSFDSDDDSSDDGFWETCDYDRKIRSKSVIQDDDFMDDSSPEKQRSSASRHGDYSDVESLDEEKESPRSISPVEDDTDDDSDFSLTKSAAPSKSKKKRAPKKSLALTSESGSAEDGVGSSRKRKRKKKQKSSASLALTNYDASNEKRRRKRLTATKTTASGPKKAIPEALSLKVGDRVYTEWAKNDWYWGVVTAIQREISSHYDQYSILFDDGDSLEYVSRRSIITESKYRAFFGREPPPPPERQAGAVPQILSPQELYARRCNECELCKKPDCGSCSTCRRNKKQISIDGGREVCLQKMCLRIQDSEKQQPAEGLPPTWTFLFKENRPYIHKNKDKTCIPGLYIYNPQYPKNSFRSVEAAINVFPKKILGFNPNAAAEFNRHIGAGQLVAAPTSKRKKTPMPSAATAPSSGKKPVSTSRKSPMTLEELLHVSCGACVNCKKDDCGQCSSCLSNRRSRRQGVCLQKICCKVPLARKAQPMPISANFPTGWSFIIDGTRNGYSINAGLAPPMKGAYGLKLLAPNGVEYYSAERAKSRNRIVLKEVSVDAFYLHIGTPKPGSRKPSSTAVSGSKGPCGVCENCTKDACGKCARCTSSTCGTSRRCFQKMCLELPVDAKAQPAVGFPSGWRFYFAQQTHSRGSYTYMPIPGLNLLSPGDKKFRSVEAAAASNCGLANESEIAQKFYPHVGLPAQRGATVVRTSKPARSEASLLSSVLASKSTPREMPLSKYRVVGSRVYCMDGKQGHWGVITEKHEAGPKEYSFTVRLEEGNSLLEDLDAGSVLSEVRYKSKTGKDPPPLPSRNGDDTECDSDQVEEETRKKQKTDASAVMAKIITTKDHFLVGRKFCFAWTDLKGQKKVVYGHVSEAEKNAQTGDVRNFKVTYSAQSRAVANLISNGCASTVPESQMLPPSLVMGGCIRFEQQINLSRQSALLNEHGSLLQSWNWITPDLRNEEFVETDDGKRFPRLTLAVRGFRLELNVKPSTIPNAGNGVFLSCTPLMAEDDDVETEPFELTAGELIDLGVYGPFRIEDKKLEAVFFAKNFVHSHKCEEWVFEAGDSRYQLDITDDVTGDIHAAAMSHVHAYVNESNVGEDVCIHAVHDAEGSVHYLLGHDDKSLGNLVVPSDGTEVEVFVNYAEGYEVVRVRKGYSFLPDAKKDHLLKVIAHEDIVDVKEMDGFGAAEVEASVDFFYGLFSKEADFSRDIVQRALTVAAVLQRHARQIFLDGKDDDATDMSSSTVNMKKVLKHAGSLVAVLLDMIQDEGNEVKALQAAGNVDRVFARVLEMQFSDTELSKLADLME